MRVTWILGLAVALAGCSASAPGEPAAQAASQTSAPAESAAQRAYDALTPKRRVSQLVMASIDTLDPAAARAVVRSTRPGGLIIMAPGNARQWRAVVRAAQSQAKRMGLPPLLIGADQENGNLVRRMRMPVTQPGAMVLERRFPLIPFAVSKPRVMSRTSPVVGCARVG